MSNLLQHTLLTNWLRGSTCFHSAKCRVVAENKDYILFKHSAHAEYVNRMTGVKNCPAYYVLYRIDSDLNDLKEDINCKWKWFGRNTDKKIIQECKKFGIKFDHNYVSPFLIEVEKPKASDFLLKAKSTTTFDGIKL